MLAYHTADECLPVQTRKEIERLSPNYTISGTLNVNWESPLLRRGRCGMKSELSGRMNECTLYRIAKEFR